MWIYLSHRHFLSTCYIPDTGLSTKVTEMKDPVLLSCCTVFINSLTEVTGDAGGDMEDCHLFQTKGFLEELTSELSFEEWIEVQKKA